MFEHPAGPPSEGDPMRLRQSSDDIDDSSLSISDFYVYALGRIGYSLPSTSRRTSIKQRMSGRAEPENTGDLLAHLEQNPHEAPAVQWTLEIEDLPVYFIEPTGPYASQAYDLLRGFLAEQEQEGVERVSLPGIITRLARHRSGNEIPVVDPAIAGMYSWTTAALVESVSTDVEGGAAGAVTNFLDRVYYELRNLGRAPHERALNFAATNAFEVQHIFASAINAGLELESIEVEPTMVSAPGTDCWDVKLTMFDLQAPVTSLRTIYRFTVDVGDVVPATIGRMRSWHAR